MCIRDSYYSVPNAHNDFIFSWIGNAAGFVGCCVVLGVLLAIIIKTFATGACSEDMPVSYTHLTGSFCGQTLGPLPLGLAQPVIIRQKSLGQNGFAPLGHLLCHIGHRSGTAIAESWRLSLIHIWCCPR